MKEHRVKRKDRKKCQHCGKTFEVRRWWQKFCSEYCRNSYHNKERLKIVRAHKSGIDNDYEGEGNKDG